jgi:hypothetical protein
VEGDEEDEEDEEEVTRMALDWKLVKIISSAVLIANAKEVIKRCQTIVFVMVLFKVQCWVLDVELSVILSPHLPHLFYLGSQPALKTTVKPRKMTVRAQVTRFNVFSALLVLLNN